MIVPPAALTLHFPYAPISPIICNCAEGQSFNVCGSNYKINWPPNYATLTNGLTPNIFGFHCVINDFKLKSLNMHICPRSIIIFTKENKF